MDNSGVFEGRVTIFKRDKYDPLKMDNYTLKDG